MTRPPGPPPPPRITLPPGIRPPTIPVPGPARPGPPGLGRPASAPVRAPSGLFPGATSRPTYREPHQTRLGVVALGSVIGAVWMALIGLLGHGARDWAWWMIAAGAVAWLAALGLARYGMRGIAAGVALASGVGTTIMAAVVLEHWVSGHWILW
jgi:hypothetical protein